MLSVDTQTRVYVCTTVVDFRKQIDGLALLVQETLQHDPLSRHVFVFRNRRGDKLKLLYYHYNGFVLVYKRLEQGQFRWPSGDCASPWCISMRELQCLLEGGDFQHLAPIKALDYRQV